MRKSPASSLLSRIPEFGWRGVTLIEVLIAVAVIAVLGGMSIVAINGFRESTRVSKLESDVAIINSAIQVYRMSGGTVPVNPAIPDLLEKLKTTATAESGAAIAGYRGAVIDSRLAAEMQSGAEAASGSERAVWDAAQGRLVVATTGGGGAKRFYLDETLVGQDFGSEGRATSNPLADESAWVWDFADAAVPEREGPDLPVPGATPATDSPTASAPQVLAGPVFSPAPGSLPLFDFPVEITITNPNPAGVSQLWVGPSGSEVLYTGQSIVVDVGDTVVAQARTIDPDRWLDSNPVAAHYTAVPFELIAELTVPSSSMTYQQAGGAMSNVDPPSPQFATVTITNVGEIPAAFQSSSNFEVVWTKDGSDPLSSGSALSSSAFENGVIPFQIPISVDDWSGEVLQIRAAARAVNTSIFESSGGLSETISIQKMALNAPVIDPPSTARSADLPVYIYEQFSGPIPVGTRIFYTTNGSDPGMSAGNPTAGTLYVGPFTTGTTDGAGVVNARMYGPSNYAQWFDPSNLRTAIYTVGSGGTGAVVGDATINGTYIGSLILTSTRNLNFNSGSSIRAGNLFVRGTPNINTQNGGVIQGRQFLSDGTEVIPATNTAKVIDLNGDPNPSNYTIRLNNGSVIEGKVYRRVNIFPPSAVAAPPQPNNNNNLNVNQPLQQPVNPSVTANVNLNNGAGQATLMPGNYGNMNSGSGTAFVLGVAGSTTPTVYNFQSLNLNSNSQLIVLGPVILTIRQNISLNSSILGNPEHPEWLNLRIHAGNFTINSGSSGYADVTAPSSNVMLNGTFRGSVIANTLTINGDGVAITQATVLDEDPVDEGG